MTLVRFSDPKFYYCFRLSLPYFDFDRRWIFFESDFRIQKIILVHQLWIVADDEYTLSPILGPKIFLSIHYLWVVADDGYFLCPIFGPKVFLPIHHLCVTR